VNDGVEIIQLGYAHVRHDVGEFGGLRSRSDQEAYLVVSCHWRHINHHDRHFTSWGDYFVGANGWISTCPITP